MDVDVITKTFKTMMDEERTDLMKKGLCFRCKKGGHLSRDCPEKKEKVVLARGKMLINTQISIATPPGTYGRIAPRSGMAAKNMIAMGARVIDADYGG